MQRPYVLRSYRIFYPQHSIMFNILSWLLLGLIAGALAKLIYPGKQGGGIFATIGLGILGALFGGWIGQAIGVGATGFSVVGIITAVAGALLLIFIWAQFTQKS